MKFLQEHHLKITALTPVHIGCGEDYTPTDYVIDDETLFVFDSSIVSDALPKNVHQRLMGLVSSSQQDDVLKQIQGLFHEHREPLMAKASHYLPVASGVAKLYEQRIGQTAQQEERGKKVINQLGIERTFYSPVSQMPVIPGSSLKGAIRTALLDFVNGGQGLTEEEKQFLGPKEREKEKANKKLQNRLFDCRNKFEKDPMRLIRLDDALYAGNDDMQSEIRFAVNRPRSEPAQGKTGRTMAEDKGIDQLLETLPGLNVRAYDSRLTIQGVSQLPQKEKVKLPSDQFHWDIKQIAQACYKFYWPLLEQEMDILDQRSYVKPGWKQCILQALVSIKPLLESNKALLLRVGRHSGAEAVTLNGVRRIKIMQGKDKSPAYESQPRTLWLAADEQNSRSEMVPFGWLLIEIDPPDNPPAVLENLRKRLSDSNQQWLEKQQCRIVELQEKLTQRKQQEEEQKQSRLAKQQAEQEKQRRLASMTEEERGLEELKTWFEQDQANNALTKQGRVPGRLHELITSATNWPPKDRMELCTLAEMIYHSLGMLKGKNGRERKAKIQKLKEGVL